MKLIKTTMGVLLVLAAVFIAGRYGWKLGGFRACQGAEIASVDVGEQGVRITGGYPGFAPKGFCGYYAQQRGDKLYAGFRFDAVFGFFETGDFDITIPVEGSVNEVILKTRTNETTIRTAQADVIALP